jgi:hypothetical protein
MHVLKRATIAMAAAGMASGLLLAAASGASAQTITKTPKAFIDNFSVTQGPSTIPTPPAPADVNPYGVAVVPRSQGLLQKGDVLVSNFNDAANAQGTGTTIVQVSPGGAVSLFAHIDPATIPAASCPGGVGLTTALSVLSSGWVIVGSLPTADGTSATAQAGCLIVLDSQGNVRETFHGNGINGPWDMTALDAGAVAELFVTNVLNDTVAASPAVVNGGTVLRLLLVIAGNQPPKLIATTKIGSGFAERTDPAALVVGPTGVGLGANGTLYVADTQNSRIAAIPNAVFRFTSAGAGITVSQNGALNGPLGLAIAPGGDILTVNGLDGNIVETTPSGKQVAVATLDDSAPPPPPPVLQPGNGTLFGLAVAPGGTGVYFVDDGENQLNFFG